MEDRALLGVQYTDMDFLSLENSRVNSFFISCLITWEDDQRGRASEKLPFGMTSSFDF